MEQWRWQRCVSTFHNRGQGGRIAEAVPTATLPPPCIDPEPAKHPVRDDQHEDLHGQRHERGRWGHVQNPSCAWSPACRGRRRHRSPHSRSQDQRCSLAIA